MNKPFSRLLKPGTLLLLTLFALNICGLSCKTPEPKILPVESFVVQKLANGNWEVKEGFVFEYFKWLAKAQLLQIKLDECEKRK